MKKSVAWIACLCMLAALLPAGALAADVAGGDYDFESDYTWNTGYNFPYATSEFTNLFQASFGASQGAEAAAQVKPVDDGRALSLLADTRAVMKGGSVTNAMKFQFRIRKDDIASGNLSVVFRTSTYAQGYEAYGNSDLTLCTFTSGGKITTLDSTVCDYQAQRWYDVEVAVSKDRKHWRLSVSDGNSVYEEPIVNPGTVNMNTAAECSALFFQRSESATAAYLDDFKIFKTDDFLLDDPNRKYGIRADFNDLAVQTVPAGTSGTFATNDSLNGFTYNNTISGNATFTGVDAEDGGKSLKLTADNTAGSGKGSVSIKKNLSMDADMRYSLKFRLGMGEDVGQKVTVQLTVKSGSYMGYPVLLEFRPNGVIALYDASGNYQTDAGRPLDPDTEAAWTSGKLYDCELIYSRSENVFKFYITNDSGDSMCFDLAAAFAKKFGSCNLYAVSLQMDAPAKTAPDVLVDDMSVGMVGSLKIKNTVPADNADSVSGKTKIRLQYNNILAPDAANTANISVTDEQGNGVEVSPRTNGNILELTPVYLLKKATTYTVSVTGVKDIFGAESGHSFSFTVGRGFSAGEVTLNGSAAGVLDPNSAYNTISMPVYSDDGDYEILLIGALYDKDTGALLMVQTASDIVRGGEAERNVTLDFDMTAVTSDNYVLNVFTWNSFSGMVPYRTAAVFN